MDRLHPIHIVTLILAALAMVFSFAAMRVAFEARDQATAAAGLSVSDNWREIHQLEQALVRAGVIEDPSILPDDHHELDGPWARCLTADERDEMGLRADDVDLPDPPCATATVEEVPCDDPVTDPGGQDPEEDEQLEDCAIVYRIDGRRHHLSDTVHPFDMERWASTWFNVEGAPEVDRLARGEDGEIFLHVIDRGWFTAYRDP